MMQNVDWHTIKSLRNVVGDKIPIFLIVDAISAIYKIHYSENVENHKFQPQVSFPHSTTNEHFFARPLIKKSFICTSGIVKPKTVIKFTHQSDWTNFCSNSKIHDLKISSSHISFAIASSMSKKYPQNPYKFFSR